LTIEESLLEQIEQNAKNIGLSRVGYKNIIMTQTVKVKKTVRI